MELDGASLLPVARRPRARTRRVVLLENLTAAGIENGRYVYLEHDRDSSGSTDWYELYDLRLDPFQLRNLSVVDAPQVRPTVAKQRPELVELRSKLDRRLDDLRACAGTRGRDACAVPSAR